MRIYWSPHTHTVTTWNRNPTCLLCRKPSSNLRIFKPSDLKKTKTQRNYIWQVVHTIEWKIGTTRAFNAISVSFQNFGNLVCFPRKLQVVLYLITCTKFCITTRNIWIGDYFLTLWKKILKDIVGNGLRNFFGETLPNHQSVNIVPNTTSNCAVFILKCPNNSQKPGPCKQILAILKITPKNSPWYIYAHCLLDLSLDR